MWTGTVIRAVCGHDLAVVAQRQVSFIGVWCGHRDVCGRVVDGKLKPIPLVEAYRCDCRTK